MGYDDSYDAGYGDYDHDVDDNYGNERQQRQQRQPRHRREHKRQREEQEYEEAQRYAQAYSEYDTTQRANVESLRKSRKYMLIGIVGFVAMCVVAFLLYMLGGQLSNAREQSCWTTEQAVESFVTDYANKNGYASFPAYLDDIPGITDVLTDCPDGGAYTWNPVTGEYTCSVHGHYPTGWNAPKSQSQGTTVTVEQNSSK